MAAPSRWVVFARSKRTSGLVFVELFTYDLAGRPLLRMSALLDAAMHMEQEHAHAVAIAINALLPPSERSTYFPVKVSIIN